MTDVIHLAPVRERARIEVLDVLRGLAILAIFYMNIPFQAQSVFSFFTDVRLIGWTPADQIVWAGTLIFLEGTQRCLLEFLFGAGMMVLTAKAMEPDGPVAIADLYYRRTMWLLAFGLFDIFIVLWTGDILATYALAAMFLFPFRKLGPKLLVGLGLGFALFSAVGGIGQYAERAALIEKVHAAEARQASGQPATPQDSETMKKWRKAQDALRVTPELQKNLEWERKAHSAGAVEYYGFYWTVWQRFFIGDGLLFMTVLEAFFAMLIGVALWKWGIVQGQRGARFYAVMAVAAYAFGLTARWIGVQEILAFAPIPSTFGVTGELARLATGLGHVALINLIFKAAVGRTILGPFRAAGRVAFSLYFLEQIIGVHILFSPYGLNLWGRFGWAGMAAIATAVILLVLIIANVWTRYFAMGPMEWAWRSLAYLERQPFRKMQGAASPG
jgi:uncharacterized protein